MTLRCEIWKEPKVSFLSSSQVMGFEIFSKIMTLNAAGQNSSEAHLPSHL